MNKLEVIALIFIMVFCFIMGYWLAPNSAKLDLADLRESPINWELEKTTARKAKENKERGDIRWREFEEFCGVDNVWTGIDYFDGEYGIFGCKDYSKVSDNKIK